jgi:hypothetical protein
MKKVHFPLYPPGITMMCGLIARNWLDAITSEDRKRALKTADVSKVTCKACLAAIARNTAERLAQDEDRWALNWDASEESDIP